MSYTLLIIDDDEDIRLILGSLLASIDDLITLEAEDGATGRSLLEMNAVDGVILDYQLPDTSGEALLRTLKDLKLARQPDVVMLSARDDQDLMDVWLGLGAKAVLKKPFNPFELLTELRTHFEF